MRTKRYGLDHTKFLSLAEEESLSRVLSLSSSRAENTRNVLFILLGLETGARMSELLAFTRADFSPDTRSVLVRGIKGSNDREVPLSNSLYARVDMYLRRTDGERLFPFSARQADRIWRDYRTCSKSFHSLRHTFALNAYRKTRDIRALQLLLGHRSITNTMIYLDYVYSTEEMRAKLHGTR